MADIIYFPRQDLPVPPSSRRRGARQAPPDGDRPPAAKYQLRIELLDLQPAVWRRLEVPDATLAGLHLVITAAMPWGMDRAYLFRTALGPFADADDDRLALEDEDGPGPEDSRRIRLSALFPTTRGDLIYEQDPGRGWQHRITCEAIRPNPEGHHLRPRLLDGAHACPPDCVPGPGADLDLLELAADPGHPGHRSAREALGLGKPWDPHHWDRTAVMANLEGLPGRL